jgi:hypothetical protein
VTIIRDVFLTHSIRRNDLIYQTKIQGSSATQ